MDLVQSFDNNVKSALSFLDRNQYISAAITVFLIVYAGMAAPRLPEYIARLFDNSFFKLLILFLIAYAARENPTVAIIAAIGLMVTLQVLNRYKINQQLARLMMINEQARAEEAAVRKEAFDGEEGEMVPDVQEIAQEQHVPSVEEDPRSCVAKANFRNAFYPQYVNMKPDAYLARYTGDDVAGFDSTAGYASI